MFVKSYALVIKINKDYILINKKGEECQVGDIQSADEYKIINYEYKQNKLWFGRMADGEILKVK